MYIKQEAVVPGPTLCASSTGSRSCRSQLVVWVLSAGHRRDVYRNL